LHSKKRPKNTYVPDAIQIIYHLLDKMLYTNHDSFLSELSKLFDLGRQKGKSVWITMKRYDGRTKRNPRKPNDKPKKGSKPKTSGESLPPEHKCLIRARLGNDKISAVISQKDIAKFQVSYSNLIKGNIIGLKKHSGQSKSSKRPNHPK